MHAHAHDHHAHELPTSGRPLTGVDRAAVVAAIDEAGYDAVAA